MGKDYEYFENALFQSNVMLFSQKKNKLLLACELFFLQLLVLKAMYQTFKRMLDSTMIWNECFKKTRNVIWVDLSHKRPHRPLEIVTCGSQDK